MYITLDQLISMVSNLSQMQASLPEEAKEARHELHIMINTILGMIEWIENKVAAEKEGRCLGCGEFHSDKPGLDHRSN